MILFEKKLAELSARKTGISEKWRQRLARNAWWLTAVIALAFLLISIASFALIWVYLRNAVVNAYVQPIILNPFVGWTLLITNAASTLLFLVGMVLMLIAVRPLKARRLKGWRWLYGAVLLLVLGDVIIPLAVTPLYLAFFRNAFGARDIVSAAGHIAAFCLVLYYLFQIRPKFTGRAR